MPMNTRDSMERLATFITEVSADEAQKKNLVSDPRAYFAEQGVFVPEDLEVEVHQNTPETFHLIFPPDPNELLQDESLTAIAGGKTAGSVATAGTTSTASCIPICWGCAATISSVGSVSTAS